MNNTDEDEYAEISFSPGPWFGTIYAITDIVKIIIVPAVIVIDILLICGICKNPKLNTRIDAYIFHFAVTNLIYLVSTPMLLISSAFFPDLLDTHFFYVHHEIEHTAVTFNLILMSCLALDWLLIAYRPQIIDKFRKLYNYYFMLFYVSAIVHLIANILLRLPNPKAYSPRYFVAALLVSTIVIVAIADYLQYTDTSVTGQADVLAYGLKVATLIVCLWLPDYIFHIVFHNTRQFSEGVLKVIWVVQEVCQVAAYLASVFMIWMLCKSNKHYNMAFSRMCRRSKSKDNVEEESTFSNPVL